MPAAVTQFHPTSRGQDQPQVRSVDAILEDILKELRTLAKALRSDVLRQEFYTTGEAAAILKCSAFTIRRWIKSGSLEAEKLRTGKQQDSYRIPRMALVKMVEPEPLSAKARIVKPAAG